MYSEEEEMSDTPDLKEQKLREQILKMAKVTIGKVTFVPARYRDGCVAQVAIQKQDIVEIGIDDLMSLLHQHHNALLRELEGKTEALRVAGRNSGNNYDHGGTAVAAQNRILDQVKQILADARVGGENV